MVRLIFVLLLSCFFSVAYAGGGITHMFIAQQVIAALPDAQLRDLLQNNLDAYLVGAYYPDSGYVKGTGYGEDSHWDPFIYTFADYIKEKYTQPALQNPKLVAFLFGCAAHRVSDEIMHWTFYHEMAREDFHDNRSEAHQYGDMGIDLLLNIDKNQWLTHPLVWWVPVNDLLQVYHRMGKDQYTAKEIEWGNAVIYLVGYGERLISPPAYPYLEWKMPWTAKHYYDWPVGGILMDEEKIVAYQMDLWQRLKSQSSLPHFKLNKTHKTASMDSENTNFIIDFANEALESSVVTISTVSQEDGSIVLQPPIVQE